MSKNFTKKRIVSIDGKNYDMDTGLEVDGAIVGLVKKQAPYREWNMLNQSAFVYLAKLRLTGESLNVLMILLGTCDFENKVTVSQTWIASELGMSKSQVNRAFKNLIDVGVLERKTTSGGLKFYQISHDYCWKGKVKNLNSQRRNQASA